MNYVIKDAFRVPQRGTLTVIDFGKDFDWLEKEIYSNKVRIDDIVYEGTWQGIRSWMTIDFKDNPSLLKGKEVCLFKEQ